MTTTHRSSVGPPRGEVAHLAGGYEIHYHDAGRADGEVVVLIQGSGPGANGWSNFKFNVHPLATAGYRVLVPDLLGFGYSSKPTGIDYALDLFVATILEWLDRLNVDRCTLVGNSLGGAVAIGAALQHPKLVRRLVLMGCGGVETTETYFKMPGIQKMVSGFVSGEPTREWLRGILELLSADPRFVTDELVDERFAVLKLMPKDVLARMRVPDLTPQLPKLTLPILGFWGSADQFCPISSAQKFLSVCPDCEFVLYAGVGHWVMIEKAAEFNRHLLHFLARDNHR